MIMLALGTAAGPAFSLILNLIPEFQIINFHFNLFTYPGWFCWAIWILFSIFFLSLFEQVKNHKKLYEITDADLTNGHINQKDVESFKYSELEKINANFTSINLVAKDIQTLIELEEANSSYLSIASYLLGVILFLIKVRY